MEQRGFNKAGNAKNMTESVTENTDNNAENIESNSGRIYFLLGGARCGKSEYSENLAASLATSDRVAYLATGQVIDDEMRKRIEIHKKRRPAHWQTFEIEKSDIEIAHISKILAEVSDSKMEVLLVDCITNLLFRLVYKYGLDNMEIIDNKLEKKIEKDVTAFFESFLGLVVEICKKQGMHAVIVSNEVGLGLVPPYPFGRIFRDLLGMINKNIAALSDEAYFFAAGLKLKMK